MSQKFPDGFLWGVSTAAYQVEGENDNNWSRWEPTVADELATGAESRLAGVVPRWQAIESQATDPKNYICAQAANHYHQYQTDFDIIKDLNLNAYRFSIEWSRIEPEPGVYDQAELDHYKQQLIALKQRGITPIICLHHMTNPAWVEDIGGWHNREVADRFVDYAIKVIKFLEAECNMWLTFNEANALLLSRYLGGGIWPDWPAAKVNIIHLVKAIRNMVRAHKQVYASLKQLNPDLKISHDHGVVIFKPGRLDPLTLLITKTAKHLSNLFPSRVKRYQDFLGIHYYLKVEMKFKLTPPQDWATHVGLQKSDFGWGIYPKGIYEVTQDLKSSNLPIYITENGLADGQDQLRTQFIHDHLKWLQKSIVDGADIRGYFHWSLLDNFEWSEGFWPQFGLVAVDRQSENFERIIKDSARYYSSVAEANRLLPLKD